MGERKPAPRKKPKGLIADFRRLDEATFAGHAFCPADPLTRFAIDILIDGEPVSLLRADGFNRALREAGHGDGCYAFRYTAKRSELSRHRLIAARIANAGDAIGQPIDLVTQAFERRARALGGVEWMGGLRLSGMVAGGGDPQQAPTVRVLDANTVVAEGAARRWSPKRRPGDPADALHFDLHLPPDYADGRSHLLRVIDDDGHDLDGSPISILAFHDGLRCHLQKCGDDALGDPRGAWFDRLLPMSLPFSAYESWSERLDPSSLPATVIQTHVRVVLVGERGANEAVRDLTNQTHENWSATVVPSQAGQFSWSEFREALYADVSNDGIAVFTGAAMRLKPHAVAHLVGALMDDDAAAAAYGDIEVLEADESTQPIFFGAFDYERMLEQGYAGYVFAIRTGSVVIPRTERVGSLARLLLSLFDGVKKESSPPRIVHMPGVIAAIPRESLQGQADALEAATSSHLQARGLAVTVTAGRGAVFPAVKVARRPSGRRPLVSIVIPTRDRVELLSACITSIRALTQDARYEIVIVDNDSAAATTLNYLDECGDFAKVVPVGGPFNYSRLNNRGVDAARGDVICLLNNDTEIIDPHWLTELLSRLAEPNVGGVAPMLLWPNRMVQHGGIVLGPNFAASDAFNDCLQGDAGYGDLLRVAHEPSAVTAACLLVRRADYLAVSGFDEIAFPVLFNDVDFCLRLKAKGRRIVFTPHTALLHHEAGTRGGDTSRAAQARFKRELAQLRQRWGRVLADDPAYSPFLNLDPYPFSALAWPPRPAVVRTNGFAEHAISGEASEGEDRARPARTLTPLAPSRRYSIVPA